ncbi:MAG: glutamine--fructose-6-phosphate aminotransferase, partial [Pseudomonadota bacterium]
MCGIVAATAKRDVVPILIAGLKALEYRGYDSAGLAVLEPGNLQRLRAKGKVRDLEALQATDPIAGSTGIAHTRWATHGVPNTSNAHPLVSRDDVSVVHNGIIENHEALRAELRAQGYVFQSQTYTEFIEHLVHSLVKAGAPLFAAVRQAVLRLEGAYASAVVSTAEPHTVGGSRRGSPLLLGVGHGGSGRGENFLASDTSALLQVTKHVAYLEEGDVVEIRPDGYTIVDADGHPATRAIVESQLSADAVELGTYSHYMQKEIFEQPGAIANTLEMVTNAASISPGLFGADAGEVFGR